GSVKGSPTPLNARTFILFFIAPSPAGSRRARSFGDMESNNFIADVFPWARTQPEGSLSCAPSLDFIRKREADSLARLRAQSWFSGWRWSRLRRTPAWEVAPERGPPEAPRELRPEQVVAERAGEAMGAEAVEQFNDRMVRPNSCLRSMVWNTRD